MKKVSIIFLAVLLAVVSYLDTSTEQTLSDQAPFLIGNPESDSLSVTADSDKQEDAENLTPTLEKRLVNQEKIDGYVVETYREYEIYKDEKGRVEKAVPTSNYDFIRYKTKES